MYLKTHSLDLKPKKVNTDPLKLSKICMENQLNSSKYHHQLDNRKFPRLLNSCKQVKNSQIQPTKLKTIKLIEKTIKNRKDLINQNNENQQYQKIQRQKIYLEIDQQKIDQNLQPISREQRVDQLYHQIFVLPKQKQIKKISEEVTQKLTLQEQTIKEKIREQKIKQKNEDVIENPQFIIKQNQKKSRLISALGKNTTTQKDFYDEYQQIQHIEIKNQIRKLRIFSGNNFQLQKQENSQPQQRAQTAYVSKRKSNIKKFQSAYTQTKYGKITLNEILKQQQTINQIQQEGLILNNLIEVQCDNIQSLLSCVSSKNIQDNFLKKYIKKNLNSGIYFKKNKNYEKALICFKKLYNKIKKENQIHLYAFILNSLSICYYQLSNYNSAYQLNLEMLDLKEQQYTTIAYYNLIRCSDQINNLEYHEYYLDQYKQHIQNFEQSSFQNLLFDCQKIIFLCKIKQAQKAQKILDELSQYQVSKEFEKQIFYLKLIVQSSKDFKENKKVQKKYKDEENITDYKVIAEQNFEEFKKNYKNNHIEND